MEPVMTDSLWFEEDLVPDDAAVWQAIESTTKGDHDAATLATRISGTLRCTRVRWKEVQPQQDWLTSHEGSRFVLARLGFEFDMSDEAKKAGSRFVFARCSAYLSVDGGDGAVPTVYDIFPRDLYEGEPGDVQIKISPKIKIGPVEAAVGEMATELTIGRVEPVIVGWSGKDEREPYWELRPKSKTLLGVRYFWMVIDIPSAVDPIDVAVEAIAELETPRLPNITLGPKKRGWARRHRQSIGGITLD
jgi:hypothetical protein